MSSQLHILFGSSAPAQSSDPSLPCHLPRPIHGAAPPSHEMSAWVPGFTAIPERHAPIPPPPPGVAASVPVVVPEHCRAPILPSYPEMVLEAIDALSRGNASKERIATYIKGKYSANLPTDTHVGRLVYTLASMVLDGNLFYSRTNNYSRPQPDGDVDGPMAEVASAPAPGVFMVTRRSRRRQGPSH